ncbi:hypothetical protein D3C76_822060 [compost metagenome]
MRRFQRRRRHLHPTPVSDGAVLDLCGDADRLQWILHLVGHAVIGFEQLRGVRPLAAHIPGGHGGHPLRAFVSQRRSLDLGQFIAVETGQRRVAPLHLEQFAPLVRGPVVVRQHRHARDVTAEDIGPSRHLDHLAHARYLQRRRAVHRHHIRAHHGSPLNHRHQHPRQHHVDAVLEAPADLGLGIALVPQLADVLELRRVLERDLGRRRQIRGDAHQFAVAEAAFARRMNDAAFFGTAAVGADLPLPGRRRDQQRTRRRAGHAQTVVLQRHAGAAARGKDFPDRVNVGVEKRILRRDHLHGHRVDVQFLGHASGQRGMRAGTGVVLVHHQFHRAVRQDAHPGVGFELTGGRRGFRVRRSHARRQVKRDGQSRRNGRRLLEKHTTRKIHLRDRHHASFGADAARLIALLIRP